MVSFVKKVNHLAQVAYSGVKFTTVPL